MGLVGERGQPTQTPAASAHLCICGCGCICFCGCGCASHLWPRPVLDGNRDYTDDGQPQMTQMTQMGLVGEGGQPPSNPRRICASADLCICASVYLRLYLRLHLRLRCASLAAPPHLWLGPVLDANRDYTDDGQPQMTQMTQMGLVGE
jgi:hypothetical protein